MNKQSLLLIPAFVGLLGDCTTPITPGVGEGRAVFACCTVADLPTVLHPGDTFRVRWTKSAELPSADHHVVRTELNVSLSVGYQNVGKLKDSESKTPTILVKAPTVRTNSSEATAPASVITIPRTATPGLYDLSTSRTTAAGEVSAGHILRITAPIQPPGA